MSILALFWTETIEWINVEMKHCCERRTLYITVQIGVSLRLHNPDLLARTDQSFRQSSWQALRNGFLRRSALGVLSDHHFRHTGKQGFRTAFLIQFSSKHFCLANRLATAKHFIQKSSLIQVYAKHFPDEDLFHSILRK